MGQRMNRREKSTARLVIRKETVRHLRTLTEEQLRGAVGGGKCPPPPPRPSQATC